MSLKKVCLLLACVTLLNGCAIFKVGDLPQAMFAPASPDTPKPSISYNVRAVSAMGAERDLHPKAQAKVNEKFGQLLRETGCFGQVSTHNKNADIKLYVRIVERSNPAAPIGSFITGYSFFTIPSWTTIRYEVTATAKNSEISKTYRVDDKARMFMWLPLVIVSPFYNISTITDMQENLYFTVFERMRRDGLLVKKVAAPILPEEAAAVDVTVRAEPPPPAS